MRAALTLLLATLPAAAPAAEPRFIDRAPALGIDHAYAGGWEHFVGGGIAVFDCDGDDLAEIYAAGGDAPAALLRNRSARGGSLDFAEQTPKALALTHVTGAYPLDVDGDGWVDLAILRVGENMLMRGGPDCAFTPSPAALGFDGGDRWTTAFSATWERGETLPTLAFGNYVNRDDPDGPFEACDVNHLIRPEGDRYRPPAALTPGWCALSILFTDWARTGRADLRVSNDRHYYIRGGAEQLWAMAPTPRLYSEAEGWRRQSIWGMGIASRDIDGDGRAEVALTSMGDQLLQHRDPAVPGPRYLDAPYETGATAHRPFTGGDGRPSTGWHAEFGDVDNDGRDDLFIAKGNVDQMPGMAMDDPNNLLMGQSDGTFREAAAEAGLASMARSRGAALVDLNLDGRLDVAVTNRRAALEIHENVTERAGGFLLLRLRQPAPNPDAVGAFVEVRTAAGIQTREITVGGGHASGHAGTIHFGLGAAEAASVRVIWPDGAATGWSDVAAGAALLVRRVDDGVDFSPLRGSSQSD